jgi:hypothetical protein
LKNCSYFVALFGFGIQEMYRQGGQQFRDELDHQQLRPGQVISNLVERYFSLFLSEYVHDPGHTRHLKRVQNDIH